MMKMSFSRLKASMERGSSKGSDRSQAITRHNSYTSRTQSMTNVCSYGNCKDNLTPGDVQNGTCGAEQQSSRSTSTRSIVNLCRRKPQESSYMLSDSRHILQTQRSFLNAVRCKIARRLRQPANPGMEQHEEMKASNWLSSKHSLDQSIQKSSSMGFLRNRHSLKSKVPAANAVHPVELGAIPKDPAECLRVHGAVCPTAALPLQENLQHRQDNQLENCGQMGLQKARNDLLSAAGPSWEWSLAQELRNLLVFGWYWGPISRAEAEELLSIEADGAFLVRDSSDDHYVLSLSFRSCGKTRHTRIQHCNSMFSFYVCTDPDDSYPSIPELIERSMERSQGGGVLCYSKDSADSTRVLPVRLTQPVSRLTRVRSLQSLCRFVIRQRVRLDLIQQLPLPSTVKTFIEEKVF
ncbi:uncharacterized protein LOC119089454 [Pollicipes pollicipes]|uniref:uncharacterized protein LOC119089454 n=1 Tax=Pollicipes pollicipes TaxID=41117 RepID=UPI0018855790|nr:uncharacterized protein LOC119089454 [Pollicipes pollicipes]XP_037068053.1 uncharacterized protein LOC119089454 [Pollicipes pollicipes]XP_037068054.1 uncharacterized protein LOC119089454 [Pollicipes pollicipes]